MSSALKPDFIEKLFLGFAVAGGLILMSTIAFYFF